MEHRCPSCNAVLISDNDKYKCEYCKLEFNSDYFNDKTNIDFIIPFEIDKKEAFNLYKKLLRPRILVPREFKNVKDLTAYYIPGFVYNLDSTGEVEFEGSKISSWKSNGVKYKKTDIYKIVRSAEISFENIPISNSNDIDEKFINFKYNYENIKPFDFSYIKDYKIYSSNRTRDELLLELKAKAKEIFIDEIQKSVDNYDELKVKNSSINLYNPKFRSVLFPIYILSVKYKDKNFDYVINGQTGQIKGFIPIDKKKNIYIWIILFVIIFILLLLLNILGGVL